MQESGKRIAMQNIGKDKSEPARKEIEEAFKLVKAENRKKREYKPEPVSARVQYGKVETKKAIENVLNFVVNNYKYTSLPELNAVLKLYNIEADKGSENSRVAKHSGLLYHALDGKGTRVGVPIKASRFHDKPTLKKLEKKFAANEIRRQTDKSRIKTVIDMAFMKNNIIILPQLVKQLQKEGIDTVLRQNAEGLVYGITFVDHKTKSVFNGSKIGKEYSVKGLQNKLIFNRSTIKRGETTISRKDLASVLQEHNALMSIRGLTEFLDVFMRVENNFEFMPKEFKRKKINRKR